MKAHWRWILSAMVITALAYAARFVDWSAALAALARASLPLVLLAVLINAASLLLRGVRWWIFLRQAGASSLVLAVRGAIVGSGLNTSSVCTRRNGFNSELSGTSLDIAFLQQNLVDYLTILPPWQFVAACSFANTLRSERKRGWLRPFCGCLPSF